MHANALQLSKFGFSAQAQRNSEQQNKDSWVCTAPGTTYSIRLQVDEEAIMTCAFGEPYHLPY